MAFTASAAGIALQLSALQLSALRFLALRSLTLRLLRKTARSAGPLVLSGVILAGCQSSNSGSGESGGNVLRNFALYGGATVPPEAPAEVEDIVCPAFDVFPGGSSVRSGEGNGLRYQLSLNETARECIPQPDGSFSVNVGVEVLALLGPAGRPGTFSAPLRIAIKRNDKVITTRTRQVSVSIPAGTAQGSTRIVEDGFHIPGSSQGVLIEIGLGGGNRR